MRALKEQIRRRRALNDVKAVVNHVAEDSSGLIEITGEKVSPENLPESVIFAGGEVLSFSFWLHMETLVRDAGERAPSIRPASMLFTLWTPGYPNPERKPPALVFTDAPLYLPAIGLGGPIPPGAGAAMLSPRDRRRLGASGFHTGMACLISDEDWKPDHVDLWDLTRAAVRVCRCDLEALNWRLDAMNAEALDHVLDHQDLSRQLGDQRLTPTTNTPRIRPEVEEDEWVLEDWK